ncbi:hypothetical protein EVAR_90571_1 [Eumeta japonica]|uniref:Uncharacterized protein n=1 Tax=Eumeta variegata TaxID=151549 RepID=A0A4C1YUX0_EUMVA|nr:hypothetical protein EVAR_90571_1 [Eumeta japonica]
MSHRRWLSARWGLLTTAAGEMNETGVELAEFAHTGVRPQFVELRRPPSNGAGAPPANHIKARSFALLSREVHK